MPSARKTLELSICRCLAPYPQDRFGTGADLAEQLEGCRQMRAAERALPAAADSTYWNIVPWIMKRPFLWFVLLVVIPQVVASVFNISYNVTQIVTHLDDAQPKMFEQLVLVYNALMYPVAFALFAWAFFPVRRTWQRMHAATPLPAGEVAEARRQALRLPLWVAGLTAAGWLPGGVLFPAILSLRTASAQRPSLVPFHRLVHAQRPDRARLFAARLTIRDPAGSLPADVGRRTAVHDRRPP